MWLSRRFNAGAQSAAESGVVTLSENGVTDASSSLPARNAGCYAPYGYCAAVPVGEEVLVINGASGAAVAGAKMRASGLEQGEIELRSRGGASIVLKNDGSVVINTLVIDKNGNIAEG